MGTRISVLLKFCCSLLTIFLEHELMETNAVGYFWREICLKAFYENMITEFMKVDILSMSDSSQKMIGKLHEFNLQMWCKSFSKVTGVERYMLPCNK